MIFQLSDWFPKPMIRAIIVKFDQIRKNWWRISYKCWNFGGRKKFFAASSVKKISRFEVVSPEKIKRIAWKFTKTVILLGLAGYELIITTRPTALLVIYISSYPARPRRITVNYYFKSQVKIWTSHLLDNFSNNCLMNLKNSGDSTGFEPMTSAMLVQCSNQLSYEVTQWERLLKLSSKCEDHIFTWFQIPHFIQHFFHTTFLSRENNWAQQIDLLSTVWLRSSVG